MSDGSSLGIGPDRALRTILGGEQSPTEAERFTPEQVRAMVAAATPETYDGATMCMTRAVLRLFAEREETQVWPTAPDYAWTLPDGTTVSNEDAHARGYFYEGPATTAADGAEWKAHGPDLYAAAKAVAVGLERAAFEGATGFMWGFAVNQARWLMGQHPGANPAIVTAGGDR
jgi:hypothetical protein